MWQSRYPSHAAGEWMVFVPWFQLTVMAEQFNDRLELGHVLTAFLLALNVPLELGGQDCFERRRRRRRFGRFALGHIRYPGP